MKQNEYWFEPKSYGYGLTPISWEGWAATGVFVIILLSFAYLNNFFQTNSMKPTGPLLFVIEVFILSVLFMNVMRSRTKGKIKWYWGNHKNA